MCHSKDLGFTVIVSLPVALAAALLFHLGEFPHAARAAWVMVLAAMLALSLFVRIITATRPSPTLRAVIGCWGPAVVSCSLGTLFWGPLFISCRPSPDHLICVILVFVLALTFLIMLAALGQALLFLARRAAEK